jgi:hypothetical protein
MNFIGLRCGGLPFDKWRAQRDDFRTFLADFVAALQHIDFPGVNVLSTPMLSEENSRKKTEENSRVAWDSPVS